MTQRAGLVARQRLHALVDRLAADQGVTRAQLAGPARAAGLVRIRFAFAWLARTALGASWPEIGRELGDRDHTTMIHACRRAEALRARDIPFRELTDRFLATLTEHG